MEHNAFESLRTLAHWVDVRAVDVPSGAPDVEYWHGAAFEVMGTRCVTSTEETRMIVDLAPAVSIPGVKHWVRGLANIGGRVLSISDLSAFLSRGQTSSDGKQALVINGRGIHTGLVIDASFGGVQFDVNKMRTDIPVAPELEPYVTGVFPADDGDYAVFDINLLLTDADFVQAGVVTTN